MNIFKKAHEMTRRILRKGDDYRATFKLCLLFIHSKFKRENNNLVIIKTLNTIEIATNKIIDVKRDIVFNGSYFNCSKYLNKKWGEIETKSKGVKHMVWNTTRISATKHTHNGVFKKVVVYQIKEAK